MTQYDALEGTSLDEQLLKTMQDLTAAMGKLTQAVEALQSEVDKQAKPYMSFYMDEKLSPTWADRYAPYGIPPEPLNGAG